MKKNSAVLETIKLSKCSTGVEEREMTLRALDSDYLGHGEFVCEFETSISRYLGGAGNVVCVNSGTAALHLALESLGLAKGTEVLVPTITYVATYQAITAAGLVPVSCDIKINTLFIDVEDAEKKITEKTGCILPVHHSGACPSLGKVIELAKRYKLRVIEDAAQAFGSDNLMGEKIGQKPYDIVCFSFDGIKNITCGEGGAIVSEDLNVTKYCRDARFLGVVNDSSARDKGYRSWEFDVNHQGYRYHMSNINASIGLAQIEKIDYFKKQRQTHVMRYLEGLKGIKSLSFLDINYSVIMPHIFVIRCERRNELREYLSQNAIETGIHYYPNHLLTKFRSDGPYPKASQAYKAILTLPLHVDLSYKEVKKVVKKIKEFYNEHSV